jgi:MFS family permease
MQKSLFKKYFAGLTKNSLLLAFASLFSDVSTEMLYPILPRYLIDYLGANGSIVGLIEGVAQATQNIIQGFSGWLSDKFQRRKPIALVGYFLSAVSKPFIGLATTWKIVLAARFSDRLGAGGRSAPRDALIAESVASEHRGKAFGLEGIGDNLGAFLGPLLTILLFFSLRFNIHTIFYLAVIPGLTAFLMILLVKEKRNKTSLKTRIDLNVSQFPKSYWKYLLVTGVFGLGNSSNAFLILNIGDKGLSEIDTILVYAFYNLVAALISYPAGSLSDKLGRKPLLLISFVIFFISYTGFAFGSNIFLVGFLFVSYGLFQGIFRATGKSFASDFVPAHLRASSIGWYSTVVGLSGLVSSIVAGRLWDSVSHTSVFIYGAAVSLVGIIFLIAFIPNSRGKAKAKTETSK